MIGRYEQSVHGSENRKRPKLRLIAPEPLQVPHLWAVNAGAPAAAMAVGTRHLDACQPAAWRHVVASRKSNQSRFPGLCLTGLGAMTAEQSARTDRRSRSPALARGASTRSLRLKTPLSRPQTRRIRLRRLGFRRRVKRRPNPPPAKQPARSRLLFALSVSSDLCWHASDTI